MATVFRFTCQDSKGESRSLAASALVLDQERLSLIAADGSESLVGQWVKGQALGYTWDEGRWVDPATNADLNPRALAGEDYLLLQLGDEGRPEAADKRGYEFGGGAFAEVSHLSRQERVARMDSEGFWFPEGSGDDGTGWKRVVIAEASFFEACGAAELALASAPRFRLSDLAEQQL